MQAKIHPEYNKVKVTCSCGNSFETQMATSDKDVKVEICSACHPFYTGEQRLVDTEGRVEGFNKKFAGFGRGRAADKAKKDGA